MRVDFEIPGSAPRPGTGWKLVSDEYGSYWLKPQIKQPLLPWQNLARIIIIFTIGAIFGGMLVQVHAANVSEAARVKMIERELQATARLNNDDIRGVRVYHDTSGELVASYYIGGTLCSNIPLLKPSSSEFWSTAAEC